MSDLEEYDRKLFRKDHGNSCPGLVKVDFYGDGKPTLALVLITGNGAQEKAELVVARQNPAEQWKSPAFAPSFNARALRIPVAEGWATKL
jgi:hypothetical protein